MYKAILFDLDGTLTESGEGITKSVQYALEKMGRPEPDLKKLECFIGPPLVEQFQKYAGLNEEEAHRAVEYYRERYRTKGIFENTPYPGVKEMLKTLKEKDFKLGVASSKPELFVLQVLEHFNLKQYFDEISGAAMDETRTSKSEVIEDVLKKLHLENNRDQVILVGDREHDVLGARRCLIDCLAVSYGYGSKEELENASPAAIANSAAEVVDFFTEI